MVPERNRCSVKIIDKINTVSDLKSLSRSDLVRLAADIRRIIVDVVSKNGGHLASSLGAVELSIALHYVFDFPNDKVIWDVGHQAYAHKILTGRRDRFHTLRKHGGISGFTKRSESPFYRYNMLSAIFPDVIDCSGILYIEISCCGSPY